MIQDKKQIQETLENEVEKLAKQEAEKLYDKNKHEDWDIYNQLVFEDAEMIKLGYNKAKEKYKYTEEDLQKAIEFTLTMVGNHWSDIRFCLKEDKFEPIRKSLDDYIKSIKIQQDL